MTSMPCGPSCRCGRHPMTTEDRFWSKVDRGGDCWLWMASVGKRDGYGRFWYQGRPFLAHRFAYIVAVGVVPAEMEIDHRATCPKNCVNPTHLRVVTRKQNGENLLGAHRDNPSGVRGVSWDKGCKRWRGQVTHLGERVYVGLFDSIEDAEVAVIARRNELFTHNDVDRVGV